MVFNIDKNVGLIYLLLAKVGKIQEIYFEHKCKDLQPYWIYRYILKTWLWQKVNLFGKVKYGKWIVIVKT